MITITQFVTSTATSPFSAVDGAWGIVAANTEFIAGTVGAILAVALAGLVLRIANVV